MEANLRKILIFTYPSPDRAIVISLVEDDVKNHKHNEGGVICNDSLASTEPPFIGDIEPSAKNSNSGNAVKHGLHQEKHHIDCRHRIPLRPVSKLHDTQVSAKNMMF